MLASKTPRQLNTDPYPWRIQVKPELLDPSERTEYIACRDGERISEPGWTGFWDQEIEECIYDPRPEFDHVQHNEPNPILVEFRSESTGAVTALKTERYLALIDDPMSADEHGILWSRDARDHARRVLTRLANFTA